MKREAGRSGPPATVDRSTQLSEERTQLATERTFLAAERTLQAWIRTSLSMISFGFTIVKFFQYLVQENNASLVGYRGGTIGPASVGFSMITIGTLALVFAIVQHRGTLRSLRAHGLASRWSLTLTIASLVAVLGAFTVGILIFNF